MFRRWFVAYWREDGCLAAEVTHRLEVAVAPSVTVPGGSDSLHRDEVAGALPCTYHPGAARRATERASPGAPISSG